MNKPQQVPDPVKYFLDPEGSFVIENYNQAAPFSNFFPGIAGVWGIPMWVFYVNRGQCISSFGIESKDKSILEFQPANKAYRLTSLQGFRTFLKIKNGSKLSFYEPFQNRGLNPFQTKQTLSITSHDLTLAEQNFTLGLNVRVNYFTLPEEPYPALIRQVTIENISEKKYEIELLDGLPSIIPYGMTDWLLKNMSRTVEAWVMVRNLKYRAPFYHLKVVVSDRPAVNHITEGNFYFAFEQGNRRAPLLPTIVEAACVFGNCQDFIYPENFFTPKPFAIPKKQETSNRTPCAMSFDRFSLNPKSRKQIISLTGYAYEKPQVNEIVKQVTSKNFIEQKSFRNKELIGEIKNFTFTNSSSLELNEYCGQNFLDNVLRGGLPVTLKTQEGNVVVNIFSRKHGDPERDYNFFVLAPTYYSQGNGNYRDVNQNRRNDVWFNPQVNRQHIRTFLNLIQADGYNPLIVKGLTFSIKDEHKIKPILNACTKPESREKLKELLIQGFQLGELLQKITQKEIHLTVSVQAFLQKILGVCHKNEIAEHAEGYWIDHWTYNLDLIESFLSLYPEELKTLLLEKQVFSFYFDSYYILSRDKRYLLTPSGVRQYHSIFDASKEINPSTSLRINAEHSRSIKAKAKGNKLRIKNGEGGIYRTSLLVKLLCLVANKASSFDPSGIGLEMEADKPNWYDALNGLPGLLGSSICETFELKRLCRFVLKSIQQLAPDDQQKIKIFEELAAFILGLSNILELDTKFSKDEDPDFSFWMKSNEIKEHYRHKIRFGISGEEIDVTCPEIKRFLTLIIEKTDQAILKAGSGKGSLYPSYFMHEVTQYELLSKDSSTVRPLKFKRRSLPLFLEGFVHGLRTQENPKDAKKLYLQVKKSALFDKELRMYKVNADVSRESEEIGRTRIFPAGWLENESVWLHMEYKFLLEVLRCGLYEEFYQDFRSCVVAFLNPARYGRSILENSSFIVSSAHEDKALHGRGFVARLSGSTAEFLHIWLLMNVGQNSFRLDPKGELTLQFRPALAGWLFTHKETEIQYPNKEGKLQRIKLPKNTYAFNFLGKTLVVYHNPHRGNTFGPNKIQIKEILLSYFDRTIKPITISSPTIPSPYAHDVRSQKIKRIDVFFRISPDDQ